MSELIDLPLWAVLSMATLSVVAIVVIAVVARALFAPNPWIVAAAVVASSLIDRPVQEAGTLGKYTGCKFCGNKIGKRHEHSCRLAAYLVTEADCHVLQETSS